MPAIQESTVHTLRVGLESLGDDVLGIGVKREQYLREVPTAVEFLAASYQVLVTASASMV